MSEMQRDEIYEELRRIEHELTALCRVKESAIAWLLDVSCDKWEELPDERTASFQFRFSSNPPAWLP